MSFFTTTCPNCGQSVSKDAEFCSHCGCPASGKFTTCTTCAASVGVESKFCWKCGAEQPSADQRKSFYGDRWHRSASDFAVRVDLAVPEKSLHHGLQIDDGTLALLFQNGRLAGTLEPGYHTFDNFLQRLLGFDKGKQAHAILLDTQAADVDFQLQDIRTAQQVPVDVRLRLLFQIADHRRFVDSFFKDQTASFTTADLTRHFQGDVREAIQVVLARRPLDEIACEARTRELIEGEVVRALDPALARNGLKIVGVRLADFSGPAMDQLRTKLGDIARLNRENDLNRALQDALRTDKISAFRSEEELRDHYEKITQQYGFASAQRAEEKRLFVQTAEHQFQAEGLKQDYERRRAEILNRLDEQKLTHQAAILDVRHDLEVSRLKFDEQIAQRKVGFSVSQDEQKVQSLTDLEVAKSGIEALKLVKQAKLEALAKEEALKTELESERLKIRSSASMQALLASVDGPQADRLLKLAELEMRRGLSAEQALALVAEKSPEIAPAVAAAIRARNPEKADPSKSTEG